MTTLIFRPALYALLCALGFIGAIIFLNTTPLSPTMAALSLVTSTTLGAALCELPVLRNRHPVFIFVATFGLVGAFVYVLSLMLGAPAPGAELWGIVLIAAGLACMSR
ncbi:hypothetical protein DDZ14_11670 [Maritimibacter sp. 55A14]|uniref:hypothetical protein n=1 Tax=Maritimibacter sp. 55A14 TaxID=2174844 RepID=UPI000D60D802|nr:hypothetical protein [Maritimibacter sp. 55A14]PWE32106.1 hypothetical protein DDZ14_11670 [Maritimibacter sp. 55A14]